VLVGARAWKDSGLTRRGANRVFWKSRNNRTPRKKSQLEHNLAPGGLVACSGLFPGDLAGTYGKRSRNRGEVDILGAEMMSLILTAAIALAAPPLTADAEESQFVRALAKMERELAKINLKPLTVDDYDARRQAILQESRHGNRPNAGQWALDHLEGSRVREYPSGWPPARKHALYEREVRLVEQARDSRTRQESRVAIEKVRAAAKVWTYPPIEIPARAK
jgi:hypothetical protein